MGQTINKIKGMIKMCCCLCSCSCRNRNNNYISGTFTQNIPVTMSYRITPINIGNGFSNFN